MTIPAYPEIYLDSAWNLAKVFACPIEDILEK